MMSPEIPEWLGAGLLGLLGIALTVGGAVVGHVLSARAQKRAATVQAEAAAAAAQVTRENQLIDQLQEELGNHRAAQAAQATEQSARMLEQDKRMNDLEKRNDSLRTQNDGYRDLLHKHRAHIYDQLPPPPPEWPDHLPR